MTADLKPYPAMKPSGVEWLGEVPEHWNTRPLRHWVTINAEMLPETTDPDCVFRYVDIGSVGTGTLTQKPQRLRFAGAPSRARRIVHNGDTLGSTVRTYLKAIYFVPWRSRRTSMFDRVCRPCTPCRYNSKVCELSGPKQCIHRSSYGRLRRDSISSGC